VGIFPRPPDAGRFPVALRTRTSSAASLIIKSGRNNLDVRALPGMNQPNPFQPVIYSSTTLLLVAFALALTML
jgi:hypothetical protein